LTHTTVPGKITAAWRHGSVEVILSSFILDELRRVLPRLSSRDGLTTIAMNDLVDILSIETEVIDPLPTGAPDLRDASDQSVLGTLLAAMKSARVDYLVTGDKDLLALAGCFSIVTPADFWAHMAGFDSGRATPAPSVAGTTPPPRPRPVARLPHPSVP